MPKYIYKEIGPELWPDFERLFGTNGACGGCWCQWWRVPKGGKMWEMAKGETAKQATRDLIMQNKMTGLLCYDNDGDEKPVGWCSYGPRSIFPRTERIKGYARDDTENIWSINCFFIDKNYRGQGVARGMISQALKFIKKRKVKIVEGYPVTSTKEGKRLPPAFSWKGPLKIFEEVGFEIVQQISHAKPLVRKKL